METVFLSLSRSDLQDLIAETITACLRHNQPNQPQPPARSGTATREQAAQFLNITLPTLHQYTITGKVRGQRLGRRVLYRWNDLEQALIAIKTGGAK